MLEVGIVLLYHSSRTTMKSMSESVKNKENDVQGLNIFAFTASGRQPRRLDELAFGDVLRVFSVVNLSPFMESLREAVPNGSNVLAFDIL